MAMGQPEHPRITSESLEKVSHYLRYHLKQPRHTIPTSYVAQFIYACEEAPRASLLRSFRQDFRPAFLPARTLWITAEMACRWHRKDYLGVLELYRTHFIADYGVSQDLIDSFLQHYYDLSQNSLRLAQSRRISLVLSEHKSFPSTDSQRLVWACLTRLTYHWPEYPLSKLYEEFLLTVRESQGTPASGENTERQRTHRLPPATRLDASHFAPFIGALGSRWRPDSVLRVVRDMKSVGVRPTLHTWTLILRAFARGGLKDTPRAIRILEKARQGLPGVAARRSRVPVEPREPAVPDRTMYRVAMEAHVRQRRREAAWDAYYGLRKAGYQLGTDHRLDVVILRVFRLGRVRPNKRRRAGPRRRGVQRPKLWLDVEQRPEQ